MKFGDGGSIRAHAIFLGACACTFVATLGFLYGLTDRRLSCISSFQRASTFKQVSGGTNATQTLPGDCNFFFNASRFDSHSECNITLALKHSAAAAKEGGCLPADSLERIGCKRPLVLTTHTWINMLNVEDDDAMRRLILLLRAWMLTQDLRRSRFVVWASTVLPDNNAASNAHWLRQFLPYILIQRFDYDKEVATTPLSLSQHFNSWERFNASTFNMLALQSDVFRNIILFNYGGLWLDTDSVPLRDLWDITAGLGLQFIPKFKGFIANGHIMYAACPKSDLARRRLEHMMLFPKDHDKAWPRQPSAGGHSWVFNDALSEYVRATQGLRYNISRDAEGIYSERVPEDAWLDIEVPYPIAWFDNWWVCSKLTGRNNTDFLKTTACNGTYIWHRLTKHIKGDPNTWGPYSGGDQFWDEIYDGSVHDHKALRSTWPLEPVVLTGGVTCN